MQHSPQSDLFNYLKPEQQEAIRPILRVLKRPAQEELCYALLDYLEQGDVTPPAHFLLGFLFYYLTRCGGDFRDDPDDKSIIRPLFIEHKLPTNYS